MKAKYIITGFAALALLFGCSKTKVIENPEPPQSDEEWLYDESLPVPVNFSAPQIEVASKASAQRIDDLAGLEIGVLGIATEPNEAGSAGTTGKTHQITADLTQDGTYLPGMKNVKAVVNNEADADTKTYITFKDGEDQNLLIYYPLTSDTNYSFYSYYPYNQNATPATADAFTVDYELGSADILWAEDHAQSYDNDSEAGTLEGFNARYVRTVEKNSDSQDAGYTSNFNFHHLTTGLRFYALSDSDSPNITVTGLRIVEVPTRATLYVASRAGAAYPSGTLVPATLDDTPENNVIALTGGDPDSPVLNVTPSQETPENAKGTEIGTLLVAPAASYKIEVDIQLNDTSEPATIEAEIPVRDNSYIAGSMYSLSLLVRNAVEVEIYVGLDPWIEEDVEDSIEIG